MTAVRIGLFTFLLSLVILLATAVVVETFVIADEPTVEVSWREDGQVNVERFGPEGTWCSCTRNSSTTVFWASGTSTPESFVFVFVADDGRWRVGERPVRGDMNENGVLDFADVVILFREVIEQ